MWTWSPSANTFAPAADICRCTLLCYHLCQTCSFFFIFFSQVKSFVTPQKFDEWKVTADGMGFKWVSPLGSLFEVLAHFLSHFQVCGVGSTRALQLQGGGVLHEEPRQLPWKREHHQVASFESHICRLKEFMCCISQHAALKNFLSNFCIWKRKRKSSSQKPLAIDKWYTYFSNFLIIYFRTCALLPFPFSFFPVRRRAKIYIEKKIGRPYSPSDIKCVGAGHISFFHQILSSFRATTWKGKMPHAPRTLHKVQSTPTPTPKKIMIVITRIKCNSQIASGRWEVSRFLISRFLWGIRYVSLRRKANGI